MTMIEPTERGPQDATPRKRLTGPERATLLGHQNWCCAGCGATLVRYDGPHRLLLPMIDEHILPLELGGSNDLSNRELRCVECAKAKTREDIKRIRKAARLRRDADPETRRKSPHRLRSRGFQKDPLR